MSNIAIRVESLGKMYRIGGKQERYRTLRDTLTDAFAAPFRRASSLLRGQAYGAADLKETIWALKDVSFEVKHGEVVGIIGRNGAGKSTLLKILSRITEPTEGYADVYGRVGSLLEVGTGFHPELTGRENIYLNGAILGMSRAEIDRKFDEIVAFAEIEKFIDTPVKHYSSGMGLRLGFAVAAHLEPEILVVDEVLAVGDAQFQKKCLGKMSEVAGEGRTVLFVSHNMGAVARITERCVWLDSGRLVNDDRTDLIVLHYLNGMLNSDSRGSFDGEKGSLIRLVGAQLIGADGRELERPLLFGEVFSVQMQWSSEVSMNRIAFFARLEADDGSIVATANSRDREKEFSLEARELHSIRWTLHSNPLLPGRYFVTLAVHDVFGQPIDVFWHVLEFHVSAVGGPKRFAERKPTAGAVYVDGDWETISSNDKSGRPA